MLQKDIKLDTSVSSLTYPRPLWRYLVLFQSWSQLQSWAMIVVLVAFIVYGLMVLFNKPFMPLDAMLIGISLGSLSSVVMVVPAQFTVSAPSREPIRFLTEQLGDMRYIEGERSGNRVLFRQNLPGFLRWDEGEVAMRSEAGIVTFSGPKFILTIIRAKLLKHIGA